MTPGQEHKRCADCQHDKPLDQFYAYKNGHPYTRCKACHYIYTQRWRAANRTKIRALDRARYPQDQARKIAEKRRQKYGLTPERYAALLAEQGDVCPICKKPFADSTLGMAPSDWTLPSVDHCHDTGVVRGILHRRCNLALEFLLSEEEVQRARTYLAIPRSANLNAA